MPVEVLVALAKRIDTVKSYEATFRYKGGKYRTTMKGRVTYDSQPSPAFDYVVEDLASSGRDYPGILRVRQFEKVAYLRMGLLTPITADRPWVRLPMSGSRVRSRLGIEPMYFDVTGMNPAAQTRMLTSSIDVEEVGPEQVDGAPTVHYKGTYEVVAGQRRTYGREYPTAASVDGVRFVNFDLWLDQRGLPRKIALSEVKSKDNTVRDLALILRFRSFDEPVKIARPAADETMSVKELNDRAAGLTP